ncbi:MAG: hypothetical protein KJT03_02010 [Verrucomicrobiae bacterium]|nr:hypothetical protein [Verrucomicrobiae bacterium]
MNPDLSSNQSSVPECGVLYIATGRFLEEAKISAGSLKKQMPRIHTTVISETDPQSDQFDSWIRLENATLSGRDKVLNMKLAPYERTIFLDSDTYVAEPLDDLFSALDDYDFLATIAVARGYWYKDETGVPKTFPELNGGMLAFRNTPTIRRIWDSWETEYDQSAIWQKNYGKRIWDQPSMRKLLWENRHGMRLGVLPTEYNVLSIWGSFLFGKPVILHTRHKPERMLEWLNKSPYWNRVWLDQIGCLRSPYDMSFKEWLVSYIRIQAVFLRALFTKDGSYGKAGHKKYKRHIE